MKEKSNLRIFKNFLIFFIYILIIELIIRSNIKTSFFDWALLRIIISSSLLSIVIGIILSVNNKWFRI